MSPKTFGQEVSHFLGLLSLRHTLLECNLQRKVFLTGVMCYSRTIRTALPTLEKT